MTPRYTQGLPRTDYWLDCNEGFRHRYTALEPSSPRPSWRRGKCVAVSISSVVMGVLLFITGIRSQQHFFHQHQQRRQEHPQQQLNTAAAAPEADALSVSGSNSSLAADVARSIAGSISLRNSYSADEVFKLDRLYPWRYLAEPHRTSVLMIETQQTGLEARVVR